MLGTNVNKVKIKCIDLGQKIRIGVDLRLDLAPVVLLEPISSELPNRFKANTLRFNDDGLFFRPARRFDPAL
ncbi:hypothetical protein N182_38070 [Sinorhizobium sp. GL2]|nr:hypothetical protein N182_38070 [Sinorhizobium sp. GL2]